MILKQNLKKLIKIFYLISLFTNFTKPKDKTELIIECVRHGARKAMDTVPSIPIPEGRESKSELTITGMRNHFNLGRLIRMKYQNFLGEELLPQSVVVKSSSRERTVVSSFSQVNGLFYSFRNIQIETPTDERFWSPPGFDHVINKSIFKKGNKADRKIKQIKSKEINLDLDKDQIKDKSESKNLEDDLLQATPGQSHFIPIHPAGAETDFLFHSVSLCPHVKNAIQNSKKRWLKTASPNFTSTFKILEKNGIFSSQYFPEKSWNLENALLLMDNLISSIFNDGSAKWNYELLLHLITLHSIKEAQKAVLKNANRFSNHHLFKDWLRIFEDFEKSTKVPIGFANSTPPKFVIYSGHDTTITHIASALFHDNNFDCINIAYQNFVANAHVASKNDFLSVVDQVKSAGCIFPFQFASNFIFEIFSRDSDFFSVSRKNNFEINQKNNFESQGLLTKEISREKKFFVRFLYNNEIKSIRGEFEMPMEKFKKIISELLIPDFKETCGNPVLKDKNSQDFLKNFLYFTSVLLGVVILANLIMLCYRPRQKIKKAKIYDDSYDPIRLSRLEENSFNSF